MTTPLKWPISLFGYEIHFYSHILLPEPEVDQWVIENIKYSKYTSIKKTPSGGWKKYFVTNKSVKYGYKFLFKTDAMAFKLRWME